MTVQRDKGQGTVGPIRPLTKKEIKGCRITCVEHSQNEDDLDMLLDMLGLKGES